TFQPPFSRLRCSFIALSAPRFPFESLPEYAGLSFGGSIPYHEVLVLMLFHTRYSFPTQPEDVRLTFLVNGTPPRCSGTLFVFYFLRSPRPAARFPTPRKRDHEET